MPDNEPGNDRAPEDKPPYISLTTLQNFLDRLGEGVVPPRIDKTSMDTFSGGTQGLLMGTLRQMGFLGAEGEVLPPLREAVSNQNVRMAHLDRWARQFYAEQLRLAEQGGTAGMLHESFARHGYSGSTLRKAVVFYLALVDYLGLPTSPHFKPPKQSATPSSRKRVPRPEPVTAPTDLHEYAHQPAGPKGERTMVQIGDLATITVFVDAKWMKLPVDTITSMREAIAKLEALGDPEPESLGVE